MGVTMEYIARMANVSKATVSRVVNGKTEGGGKGDQRADSAHYRGIWLHAQSGGPWHGNFPLKTIGLVIPNITNPFFPDLIRSLQIPLQAYGYTVML